MKVKSIGANQTECEKEDGTTVFYSYSTPVAAFVPGRGGLCSSKKFSRTTSRHVSSAISRWGCSRTDVDQEEIDAIADLRNE